jgi:hypothetical protein
MIQKPKGIYRYGVPYTQFKFNQLSARVRREFLSASFQVWLEEMGYDRSW